MGLKVKVTKLFGGGGSVGSIDPKVNMQVDQGKILGITNDICLLGSGTHYAGGSGRFEYADKLFVLYSHVTGVWAFPTGDGSQVPVRSGLYPQPPDIIDSGSAIAVDGGARILSFGR